MTSLDVAASLPVLVLVDEDGHGVTALTNGLEQKGYTVLPWRWGNGLHPLLVRERPGLVIVDISRQRHLSLWQVLRQVRRDPATAAIPFVLCIDEETSMPGEATWHRVMRKPVDRRATYAVIEEMIGVPPVERRRKCR